MTKSKYLSALLVVVFLLILVVISWFIFQDDSEVSIEQENQDTSTMAETQEEDKSPEVSATVEVVPETSPTENTNPFEGTYKNPFE